MDENEWITQRFEEQRPRLRAVAYRMLGSLSEADDALQESWLRLHGSALDEVENLSAWLTTVVARVCLNMLRTRRTRREDRLGPHVPDPIVSPQQGVDPEHQALLADAVGLALLVVLETLSPSERLAFVLHDMFSIPFEEIAPIVGRTPAATRQLASRGRRRVGGADTIPDTDLGRQREVVEAFTTAARQGDFEALIALLDPDVVLRSDGGPLRPEVSQEVNGAEGVARTALTFERLTPFARPALVNGAAGAVVAPDGHVFAVMGFTVVRGRIVEIDVVADPERLEKLDLPLLDD